MKNLISRLKTGLLVPAIFLFVQSAHSQTTVTGSLGFPNGVALNGIAYGNGVYVAVGTAGYIIKSTNGTDWTVVKTIAYLNTTYSQVKFVNGQFMAVSQDGKIVTSTDGTTWTQQTSGTSAYLYDVVYAAGKYIIVGRLQTTLTSTDGITWTPQNIGVASSDEPMNIFYTGTRFVVGVRDGAGSRSYYSTTGNAGTWSNATIGAAGQTLNKLLYLNNRFFALTGAFVYTSTDGITWTDFAKPILTTSASNQVFHGYYDGTNYNFVGSASTFPGGYMGVYSSTDLAAFTLQPQKVTINTQYSAYLNGRAFVLGNEGLVSSSDGLNWKYPAGSYYAIATNGTRYVAVGQHTASEAAIYTSTDWNNWSSSLTTIIKPLNGVTYGNNQFVAVGNVGTTNSITATSPDGLTWTIGNSGVTDILKAVAYGGPVGATKYVAVGNSGRIVYSANGTSWTSAENGGTAAYYGVAYVNNYFVAFGGTAGVNAPAKVKYSVNGMTWTDVSPSPAISGHFNGIAYGGGKYVLTGRDNTSGSQKFLSVISTDITSNSAYSATSTVAATPDGDLGTSGFGGVAYSNSVFAAISNAKTSPFAAYILTSPDGATWTATNANNPGRLRGIIPVGTGFKVVGSTDALVSVNEAATLPLRLVDFSAQHNNDHVSLYWKTLNESNTTRFDIERSEEGRTFNTIGSVRANNTAAYNNYTYTDAGTRTGVRYYRLKMLDIDGKFTYSPVLRIGAAAGKDKMSLYPNPASGYVTVSLPLDQPGTITLFNRDGKQVMKKAALSNTEMISIDELPTGIYIVQVTQGGKTYTEKLVKK